MHTGLWYKSKQERDHLDDLDVGGIIYSDIYNRNSKIRDLKQKRTGYRAKVILNKEQRVEVIHALM
jgi:hypothetical protein